MSDDKNTAPTDRVTIKVNDDNDLQHWAAKFDATPEQIREAVEAVGDQSADVEMHLKGTHATSNADQAARANASGAA